MEVIIKDFYPCDKPGRFQGTLKIHLTEKGITILGVEVYHHGVSWHLRMPGRKTVNHLGEKKWYPFIVLDDQAELIGELLRIAPAFIAERKKQQQKADVASTQDSLLAAKQTASKATVAVWRDPPKRASTFTRGGKR